MNSVDLMSACMTITVVWNLYGFATNFFDRVWGSAPLPITLTSYLLNTAIIVLLPFSRSGARWSVITSVLLGMLMAVWSTLGVIVMRDGGVRFAGRMPGLLGPGVAAALGILTVILGLTAFVSHG